MVYINHLYINVYLAQYEIFRAKVSKGGISSESSCFKIQHYYVVRVLFLPKYIYRLRALTRMKTTFNVQYLDVLEVRLPC